MYFLGENNMFDFLVIKPGPFDIAPFNLMFFILLFLFVGLIVVLTVLFKDKEVKFKENIILGLCIFNIFFWISYKIGLYIGNEELAETTYVFNIWLELPLHLCNISLFLVPLGIIFKKKILYSYAFYISVFGAVMALLFPTEGFHHTSIFAFHNIGFYGTHYLIIVNGILPVTFGLFHPNFKYVPKTYLILIIFIASAFLINIILEKISGVTTNYFYVMHPNDISILELFWSYIPVKVLYLFPTTVIFSGIMAVETFPFYFIDKYKNEKNS